MTTIAYRAGVMAADTQMGSGNRQWRISKVSRLPCGGLIGASGTWSDALRVVQWAIGGCVAADKPDFDGECDVECIVVRGDGSIYLLDDDLALMPVMDEFAATGCGGVYALAAMECGKSPAEAVLIAAKFDPNTSEPVEVWQLEAPKPKAKIRGKARPTK